MIRLAIAGLVVSAGILMPVKWRGRAATATFDLGHAPVFALLTLVVCGVIQQLIGAKLSKKGLLVIGALLLIGSGMLEYLQRYFHRSPSWGDALANSMGILAGLLWISSAAVGTRAKWLLRGAGVLLLAAISFQPAMIVYDCYRMHCAFPMLSSFEDSLELSRWEVRRGTISISDEYHTNGERCLKWNLEPARFPRITHSEPADWSAYRTFEFDALLAESDSEHQRLTIKIFDVAHEFDFEDRFHGEIELTRGEPASIKVQLDEVAAAPTTRTMDLSRILMIELFAMEQSTPATIFLDNIRLEK